MQYLMGLASPTFAGMGLSSERSELRTPFSGLRGEQAKASLVKRVISAGVGGVITCNVPVNNRPMYSRIVAGDSLPGAGPKRFAFDARPLPLAMRIREPSAANRTL